MSRPEDEVTKVNNEKRTKDITVQEQLQEEYNEEDASQSRRLLR
jgi:hypothetical protein